MVSGAGIVNIEEPKMEEDLSLNVYQYGGDEIRQLHKDSLKRHRKILFRQKVGGVLFSVMFMASLLSIPYGVLFVPWFGFWGGMMLTMFGIVSFGFLALIGKAREEYMGLARPYLGYGLKPELSDSDIMHFRKNVLFHSTQEPKKLP
jgi:hypothetical protein